MNKTYRVCFNKARGALMVVNELTKSVQKKGAKTILAATATMLVSGLFGVAQAEYSFSFDESSAAILANGNVQEINNFTKYADSTSTGTPDQYRIAGFSVNATNNPRVESIQSLKIDVSAKSGNETVNRFFGLSVSDNKSLNISNSLDVRIDVTEGSAQIRGLRNNASGTLTVGGPVRVYVSGSTSGYMTAMDAWGGTPEGTEGQVHFKDSASLVALNTKESGATWTNAVQLGDPGAKIEFESGIADLLSKSKSYTAQTISFGDGANGAQLVFNSQDTNIIGISPYGVNLAGFSANGGIINFNSGKVNSLAIVNGDGLAVSNAMGFMVGGSTVNVSNKVSEFNIDVYGAGKFDGNPGNTNGTAALSLSGGSQVNIFAQALNINVIAGKNVTNQQILSRYSGNNRDVLENLANESITFDQASLTTANYGEGLIKYAVTTGILNLSGKVTVGADTVTNLNAEDGFWNAVGVYAQDNVEILGTSRISAIGVKRVAEKQSNLPNNGAHRYNQTASVFIDNGAKVTLGSPNALTTLLGNGYGVDFGAYGDGTLNLKAKTTNIETVEAFSGGQGTININSNVAFGKGTKVGDFSGAIYVNGGSLTVTDASGYWQNASVGIKGGKLDVTGLTLGANTLSKTTVSAGGTISAKSGQFFTKALTDDGMNTDAGKYINHGLTMNGGTITLGDAKYNLQYASNAAKLVSGGTLVFTGTLVSLEQKVDDTTNKITISEANDDKVDTSNSVFTDATLTATEETNKNNLVIGSAITSSVEVTNVVADSIGVKDVALTADSTGVAVNSGKILTLVGDGASGNLIKGADSTDLTLKVGEKKSDGTTSSGIVQLGVAAEGVTSGGTLNASVSVTTGSVLSVAGGSFAVEENKTVTNEGTMSVNTGASLSVGKLVLADTGRVEVQGNLKVQTLEKKKGSADGGVIQVGNAEAAGSLTIAKSTGGHHIFLDPVWQNGVGIEGASKLIYGDAANVTDFIVVGQNSYAVFGDTSDVAFLEAFANSGKTWGEGGTTAAVYVGKPIQVTGGLTVDGSQTSYTAPDTGAVEFAPGSVLFADVGALEAGTDLIQTAGEVTVADDSKVVLLNVESGKTYQLVTGGTDEGWGAGQIEAANAMYGVGTGAGTSSDGVTFILQTAEDVYGNQMQATEIANAAMATVGEAYNYANSVLTNIDLDKAQAAALFDAAMNPMGALGTFTTAYDRATELKAAVREEAGAAAEPRLWVRVTGGRTKLDGISTGAQSLTLKTESFGVIAGGETSVAGTTIGAAFSAGTGSTRNNAVAGKDDFSYYGLTAYAQRECAGVTFTADASATWLKSELTVGGAADVDNDADSAVYAIGLEGMKDFEVSGVTLTPFVGLDVYHLRSEGMTTKHGVKVDSANATAVEIPIGARAAMNFTTTDGTVVKPAFSLAVVPTLGDRDIDVTSRFAGAKSNMNFTFADDVQIRSNLGITAEKKNVRFGLDLGYNWGNEERSALSANVRASFLF